MHGEGYTQHRKQELRVVVVARLVAVQNVGP
jgi:hypothetical protein